MLAGYFSPILKTFGSGFRAQTAGCYGSYRRGGRTDSGDSLSSSVLSTFAATGWLDTAFMWSKPGAITIAVATRPGRAAEKSAVISDRTADSTFAGISGMFASGLSPFSLVRTLHSDLGNPLFLIARELRMGTSEGPPLRKIDIIGLALLGFAITALCIWDEDLAARRPDGSRKRHQGAAARRKSLSERHARFAKPEKSTSTRSNS